MRTSRGKMFPKSFDISRIERISDVKRREKGRMNERRSRSRRSDDIRARNSEIKIMWTVRIGWGNSRGIKVHREPRMSEDRRERRSVARDDVKKRGY